MSPPHPISLNNLLKLIKSFVDLLILASGYCSSGSAASWDAENVRKALRWGIFFEQVFKYLSQSDDYNDLIKELDASLLELTSNSYFPQGLRNLSSTSLSRARNIVLEIFSQSLSLSAKHLHALITASIVMDQEDLPEQDSTNWIFRNDFDENSDSSNVLGSCAGFVFHELSERHTSMSTLFSCEASLNILMEILLPKNIDELNLDCLSAQSLGPISLEDDERLERLHLLNRWRQKNLSYLLSKRTMKLLSGCELIFNAPKEQWARMLDSLKVSPENSMQVIELSLLGFMSSSWTGLIDKFMSFSHDLHPIREQYFRVVNFLREIPPTRKIMSEKEKEILDFCMSLLMKWPDRLWDLPPILAAVALPTGFVHDIFCSPYCFCSVDFDFSGRNYIRSSLFRSHISDIGRELNGESHSLSPRCKCINDPNEQPKDCSCDLAERIWCLYVSHIQWVLN